MKKQARRQLMLLGITHRIFLMLIVIFVTGLLFTSCKRELITTEGDTAARTVEGINKAIITETAFFEKNKGLGGDVTISKSEDKVEGTSALEIFHINVPADGEYYLSAWVNSPALDEQKSRFSELGITVNNERQKLSFGVDEAGWHSGAYMDGNGNKVSLKLKKGTNTIGFSIALPLTPSVDFVRLTRDRASSDIPDEAYKKFLNDIRKSQSYKAAPGTITDTLNTNANKSASFATMSTLPADPDLNDYAYALDKSFNYSYYMTVYLTSGKNMSFTSWAGSQVHVLEVFSANNPESQSWTASSTLVSGSQRGYVAFTVPTTGTYYVKLRSYYGMETGTASLVVYAGSGSTPSYYYNCPVTGWLSFGHSHYNGQEMNYFTAYTASGDPRLWVVDNNGFPGKVCGYNDDYYGGGGDFYWGLNSRVKKNFGRSMQGVIVSAYSSYNPTGVTDLYSGAKNSNIQTYIDPADYTLDFPNLKADDALMSAPASNDYNCAAWAGGRTKDLGRYFWPSQSADGDNYSSPWYVPLDFWQSWDNYMGNNPARWVGAPSYTTVGADASNGVIALWGKSSSTWTWGHVSVRKPGNEQAHGYDWESKPGGLMRTFHPRDALNNNTSYYGYGQIQQYYTEESSGAKTMTFEESMAKGLNVYDVVSMEAKESRRINDLKNKMPAEDIQSFVTKLNKLVAKSNSPGLIIQSNPRFIMETSEYKDFKNFVQEKGKQILPLLIEEVFNDRSTDSRDLAILIFNGVTSEYNNLKKGLMEERRRKQYDEKGAYILPSPIANSKRFAKAILTKL